MRLTALLLFLGLLMVPGLVQTEEDRAARREAFLHSLRELRAAEQFARQFLDGDLEAVEKAMSAPLRRQIPPARLADQRELLLRSGGGVRLMQAAEWMQPPDLSPGGARNARVPVLLERGEVELLLGWQGEWEEGVLRELRIRPVPRRGPGQQDFALDTTPWGERPDAEYVDRGRFREVTRRIPATGGAWSGRLAIPREAEAGERVPAVFLLPDLEAPCIDGAIGPNLYQRDLAHGLASRGIAVLRVERTGAETAPSIHTPGFVEDAAQATRALATTFGVDMDRVHLLAQRESAFFAPEVAGQLPPLRGMALLSPLLRVDAPARFDRLEALEELGYAPEERGYHELRDMSRRLEETGLRQEDVILGRTVAWWQDVRGRQPLRRLPGFQGRVLVIMPENDPLRGEAEERRWRELDNALPNLLVVRIPGTTQWMTTRAADGGPEERYLPGHVSGRVITRLERFFKTAE